MKILAITNLYPRPGRPTRAAFNRQQFHALAREHDVTVVVPVAWTEAVADRLRGHTFPRPGRDVGGVDVAYPVSWFPPRALRHRYGEFLRASIAPEVRRRVARARPDVILASWAHPDGWAAARLAVEMGLPCVTKVVGTDILVIARGGKRREAVAEGLRAADAVVAVSHDLAGRVADLGVDPGRIRVVHEGLDRGLFGPGDRDAARARLGIGEGPPIILFVGNLLMSKGAGVLVEAVAAMHDRGRAARCWMVGSGRDEPRIRSLIDRLGQSDRIRLAGSVAMADLPAYYHACDVVALPSFSEGIPNVLREALACGRPFVATRVGGIPEIVDPACCRLAVPGSAAALADALGAVLDGGPGRAAPRDPSGSWVESARALAGVLEEAVASRGSSAVPPHATREFRP